MNVLDLARQVKGRLPIRWGGTGNDQGYATAIVKPGMNRTGDTMARGTLVRLEHAYNDARIVPTTAASETTVLGIVVGRYENDDGVTFSDEDVDNGHVAAVMTQGTAGVLVGSEGATRGEYAYASDDDGMAMSDATASPGAFGIFQSSGTSSALVVLFGDALAQWRDRSSGRGRSAHVKGLEPSFHWRVKASIMVTSSLTLLKLPLRMALRVRMPNPGLDLVHPRC